MRRLLAVLPIIRRFLRSERGQRMSRAALGRAADAANRATGSKHASTVEKARAAAEKGLRRI
ncbi:hypothetical protein [Amnibacterium endophyticum]|uniref:Uncharacterized protein n=1 Tax=Amnibacterium endophyticum TaxID=2109337 RepID=A0ABW4LDZ8_9MICO